MDVHSMDYRFQMKCRELFSQTLTSQGLTVPVQVTVIHPVLPVRLLSGEYEDAVLFAPVLTTILCGGLLNETDISGFKPGKKISAWQIIRSPQK